MRSSHNCCLKDMMTMKPPFSFSRGVMGFFGHLLSKRVKFLQHVDVYQLVGVS
jgi:hypothetical protein